MILEVQFAALEILGITSVKPYSRIAAISEAFKIVNSNVLEAEQRKQLQAIRAHLDSLEDGGAQVIDV